MRPLRFRHGKRLTAEQVAELQERLAALEQLAASQQHEIADQHAEMARLRTLLLGAGHTPPQGSDDSTAPGQSGAHAQIAPSEAMPIQAMESAPALASPETSAPASPALAHLQQEPDAGAEAGLRASRRALLRWGGAAAAAGVAATAANVLGETHTAQAAGVAWQTGTVNADNMTVVQPQSASFPDPDILRLQQGTGTLFQQSSLKTALAAYDTTGNNIGVYATSSGGTGLYGVTDSGTAAQGQAGLYAKAVSTGTGVVGTSGSGIGVQGNSNTGIGASFTGGLAPLAIGLGGAPGAPTTGSHVAGEIYADSSANLYFCVGSGTPGIWNKVAWTKGQIAMLPAPIRVLDTRPTLWPGYTYHDVQVTGVNVGGIVVPGGVTAMIGNVTVTETTGGGHLRLYPQGAAVPNTSSINYTGANQTVANGVIVGLSGSGKITIYVVGGGAKVILDVAGYVV